MKFKDKFLQEHPERKEDFSVLEWGCPSNYGYEPVMDILHCEEIGCLNCWDREIPEEKEKCPTPASNVGHIKNKPSVLYSGEIKKATKKYKVEWSEIEDADIPALISAVCRYLNSRKCAMLEDILPIIGIVEVEE